MRHPLVAKSKAGFTGLALLLEQELFLRKSAGIVKQLLTLLT